MTSKKPYEGSCHCGFVKYTAKLDLTSAAVIKCNCTICVKTGYMSIHVDAPDFTLHSPASESEMGDYQFGSMSMHHYFCRTCGVKIMIKGVYSLEGKQLKAFTLNLLTLDRDQGVEFADVKVGYVDGFGENWGAGKGEKPYPGGAW